MKYTDYMALVTKENGPPQLNSHQFRRMMNIVYAEGVKHGLQRAKKTYLDTPQYHRYDMLIFKVDRQLTDLTGNETPEKLLLEMYKLSRMD